MVKLERKSSNKVNLDNLDRNTSSSLPFVVLTNNIF